MRLAALLERSIDVDQPLELDDLVQQDLEPLGRLQRGARALPELTDAGEASGFGHDGYRK